MARRPRRNHSPEFKAKAAIAALRGEEMISELPLRFDVHPNQITHWKMQLLERSTDAFGGGERKEPPVDVKTLHAKIGQLTLENDFLEGGIAERKTMIDRKNKLSVTRQAKLSPISRGSAYYEPKPVSP